jgi:hypothetical protein
MLLRGRCNTKGYKNPQARSMLLPVLLGSSGESCVNTEDRIWDQLASQASMLAADQVDPDSRRLLLEIAERYERLARRARDRQGTNPKPD